MTTTWTNHPGRTTSGPLPCARTSEDAPAQIRMPAQVGSSRVLKHALDRVAAFVGLAVLAPVLLAIALAVRLGDGGPALFKQQRLGQGGVPFVVFKFRTMRVDAEQELERMLDDNESDGLLFKLRNDTRVTRVGAWLRALSLDELPQLLNVLRGEMSLVGPRPLPVLDVSSYEGAAARRFEVRPGITGLWQVSGRSELGWDDAVRLDLQYVDTWALRTDFDILLRTIPAVLRGTGAY